MARRSPFVVDVCLRALVTLALGLPVGLAQGEAGEFVLAKDGKPSAVIVVPKGAPIPVQFAAHELTTHLEQMTGAKFQIVETKPDNGNAIVLGEEAGANVAGLDISGLKRDGYAIVVKPDVIGIAGKDDPTGKAEVLWEPLRKVANYQHDAICAYDHYWYFERGTLYGTYRFLEELGVRWLFQGPKGTLVPERKSLRVPCMELREEPHFEMRVVYTTTGSKEEQDVLGSGAEARRLWWLRQRSTTKAVACGHRPPIHSWAERFAEKHPEYFALLPDGKRSFEITKSRVGLCYTQEGVFRETMADVEAFFSGKTPETRQIRTFYTAHLPPYYRKHPLNNGWLTSVCLSNVFSLLPSDGVRFCRCENCGKLIEKSPSGVESHSRLIWGFVDQVARACLERFPNKKLSCLAYTSYKEVPEGLTSLPKNVLVGMCPYPLSLTYSLTKPSNHDRYMQLVKRWHALNGQPLLIWDHHMYRYFNRDKKGVPMVLPHLLARHIKELSQYARWMLFQEDPDSLAFENLNGYVVHRLLWNPQLDIEALLDDYFNNLYGPAAPIIRKVMADIERKSEQIGAANVGLFTIWDEHYPPEVVVGYRKAVNEALIATKGTPHEEATSAFSKFFIGAMEQACFNYVETVKKVVHRKDMIMSCSPAAGRIKIDGAVSEEAWKKSSTRGYLFNNVDGQKTKWPTELRIAHDEDLLYVSFVCFDPEAQKRKPGLQQDYLEIFLDPERECEKYYWVMIDNDGSIMQQALFKDGGDQVDHTWQSEAKIGAKKYPDRWIVEVALPLENLGGDVIDELGGEMWGANFCRTMSAPDRKDRFSGFSPVLRGAFHRPDSFGAILFGE